MSFTTVVMIFLASRNSSCTYQDDDVESANKERDTARRVWQFPMHDPVFVSDDIKFQRGFSLDRMREIEKRNSNDTNEVSEFKPQLRSDNTRGLKLEL